MNEIYNYKEEIEKIIKDKNVIFYYDSDLNLDINDDRQYKISIDYLKKIDILEKDLSEAINEIYSKNPKEEYIKIISDIIDSLLKKKENKNLVSVFSYRSCLKSKIRGLFIIVN